MTSTTCGGGSSGSPSVSNLFTATETGYYHITGEAYNTTTQWATTITVSGWTLISWTNSQYCNNYEVKSIDCIMYVTAWTTITATGTRWSYGSGGGRNFAAELYRNYDLPHGEQFPVYPRKVKEIWDIAETTLYWRDINGLYKGGIMLGTTNSATTGSITLWNAVGFIVVSFNWQNIKIPYYT